MFMFINSYSNKAIKYSIILLSLFIMSVGVSALPGDGTEEDPYEISTCEELQDGIPENGLHNNYKLVDDIDCEDKKNQEYNDVNPDIQGQGFIPISNFDFDDAFVGELDGNGYTVENLHFEVNEADVEQLGIGIIGTLTESHDESTVKNLDVKNSEIIIEDGYEFASGGDGNAVSFVVGEVPGDEAVIENIGVYDSSITIDGDIRGGFGTVVGRNMDEDVIAEDIIVENVEMNLEDMSSTSNQASSSLVVGSSQGAGSHTIFENITVRDSNIKNNMFEPGEPITNSIAGLVGYNDGIGININEVVFENTEVQGNLITATDLEDIREMDDVVVQNSEFGAVNAGDDSNEASNRLVVIDSVFNDYHTEDAEHLITFNQGNDVLIRDTEIESERDLFGSGVETENVLVAGVTGLQGLGSTSGISAGYITEESLNGEDSGDLTEVQEFEVEGDNAESTIPEFDWGGIWLTQEDDFPIMSFDHYEFVSLPEIVSMEFTEQLNVGDIIDFEIEVEHDVSIASVTANIFEGSETFESNVDFAEIEEDNIYEIDEEIEVKDSTFDYEVEKTVEDEEGEQTVETSSISVENRQPEIVSVEFNPSDFDADDAVSLEVEAFDPDEMVDSSELDVTVTIEEDGEEILTDEELSHESEDLFSATDLFSPEETEVDYEAIVEVDDGEDVSTDTVSNFVGNAAPSFVSTGFAPSDAFVNDTVNVSTEVEDPDGVLDELDVWVTVSDENETLVDNELMSFEGDNEYVLEDAFTLEERHEDTVVTAEFEAEDDHDLSTETLEFVVEEVDDSGGSAPPASTDDGDDSDDEETDDQPGFVSGLVDRVTSSIPFFGDAGDADGEEDSPVDDEGLGLVQRLTGWIPFR